MPSEDAIFEKHIAPYLDDANPADNLLPTEELNVPVENKDSGNSKPVEEAPKQEKTEPVDSNGSAKDNLSEQQPQKEGQGSNSSRPDGAIADEKGNLKLPDGSIIKAGQQRRLYEDNSRLKDQVSKYENVLSKFQREVAPAYEQQINALSAQVQAYQQANVAHTQYNLTPQEQVDAVKLAAAWKANPVETVKYLLAEVAALGHNVEGIGSSVDTMAVSRLIDNKLAPITADHARLAQEQQNQMAAANAATQFFNRFPDAKQHEQLIAELIITHPNLSPESAYYELKLAAAQRNLDWNKPLKAQLVQQQNVQQQPRQVDTQKGVTMPNGRPNAPAVVPNTPKTISGNAPQRDIIKEAMREAGFSI